MRRKCKNPFLSDEWTVRPVIASNGVPFLQMRSIGLHRMSGREKVGRKKRMGRVGSATSSLNWMWYKRHWISLRWNDTVRSLDKVWGRNHSVCAQAHICRLDRMLLKIEVSATDYSRYCEIQLLLWQVLKCIFSYIS